jgi:hypothetical protein
MPTRVLPQTSSERSAKRPLTTVSFLTIRQKLGSPSNIHPTSGPVRACITLSSNLATTP